MLALLFLFALAPAPTVGSACVRNDYRRMVVWIDASDRQKQCAYAQQNASDGSWAITTTGGQSGSAATLQDTITWAEAQPYTPTQQKTSSPE